MPVMSGPLILLAAMSATPQDVVTPAARPAAFRPAGGATARATASVRILSGVTFGASRTDPPSSGAQRRQTRTGDPHDQGRAIETLEFQ